jgi:hypothetical protein
LRVSARACRRPVGHQRSRRSRPGCKDLEAFVRYGHRVFPLRRQ